MGQAANMARASRFIDTFNVWLREKHKDLVGKTFRLDRVNLGQSERTEEVVAYYVLREVGGKEELVLTDEVPFFDPQYEGEDEVAETLAELFFEDATPEHVAEIQKLLDKAKL